MSSHDGATVPRLRVVDMAPSKHLRRKRRRSSEKPSAAHVKQPATNNSNYPLEIQPVLRATLEYGRRTHALGLAQGAAALIDIARRIKSLGLSYPALDNIICDAERSAAELQSALSHTYDDT